MIEVKIVADSISEVGDRLVSMECTYPRYIHAEVMTHRAFARNAASSRAIPVAKMLERIEKEPAITFHWGKNQKGMQADRELSVDEQIQAKKIWLDARDDAMHWTKKLLDLGLHKQIANRILEPWAHITTLITATEWGNFFNLRCHHEAHPDFQRLAWLMLKRFHCGTPVPKRDGEWHLPYGDKFMSEGLSLEQMLKISVARAARTSYLTMNNEINHEEDYALHDQLLKNGHMSPLEHPAVCAPAYRSGCFFGWRQYRKFQQNENRIKYSAEELLAQCPFKEWLDQQ